MTIIEFFDRTPIENIISSITVEFNKIIFLGNGKMMDEFKDIYDEFLKKREMKIEVRYRNINRNNLQSIVDDLSEIVEEEEQCVFDLNGGEDLALVAMGIVYNKYSDKNIQMQHFNINTNKIEDCDNDGMVVANKNPEITIDEIIGIHGGSIKYSKENAENDIGTYKWDFSDDFINDIDVLWELCRNDPKKWNTELRVIERICSMAHNKNALSVTATYAELEESFKNQTHNLVDITEILSNLQSNRLINGLFTKGERVSFTFKNKQIKKCLVKEGTVLELKVLTAAFGATRKDGTKIYDECMNGVVIDWDGGLHNETDTFNEIDIILRAGVNTIFISCKNGQIPQEELYKLDAVANEFGGENVKKVLLATYLGKSDASKNRFVKRAEDMDIIFIDNVHQMRSAAFKGMVKNLINVKPN